MTATPISTPHTATPPTVAPPTAAPPTPAQPTPAQPDGRGGRCQFCSGRSFRRSRLQMKDLLPLLLLRYPVRCLSCGKRRTVGLLTAQRARSFTAHQAPMSQGNASWNGWNSSGSDGVRSVPGPVGGSSFTALPVRAPIVMPELEGVTLKHAGDRAPEGRNVER